MPPSHTQITRRDLVNADTRTRLTMYATQFLAALAGLQRPELIGIGEEDTTSALDYKTPIAVGSSNWTRWVNGIKYRDVGELLAGVLVSDWSDGVRAEFKKLQSDAWANFGWGQQPTEMAEAAQLIPVRLLAALLEAGSTTGSIENNVDGDTSSTAIKIFGQGKPVDPLGSNPAIYSNRCTGAGTASLNYRDAAAPLNLKSIDRVKALIRTQKAQNGTDYKDLTWKWTLVHPEDEAAAERYFHDQGTSNDTIYEPTSDTANGKSAGADLFPKPNTAKKYKIQVISVPYFTRPGVWYPIAVTRTRQKAPWLSLTQIPANEVPLAGAFPSAPPGANPLTPGFEWILDWVDSHLYKHGIPGVCPAGYVAIGAKRSQGVAIVEPWRVFECNPT